MVDFDFLLFILGIVIIIAIVLGISYHKRKLLSKEILAAIEKGIDIPFPEPKQYNFQAHGIVWVCVGIVFAIALWISAGLIGFIWGLLPVSLGIGFVMVSRFGNAGK